MKKNIVILATALTFAVAFTGCSENRSVTVVKGSYSYKTSGSVKVADESINLTDESGQMEVVSLHKGDSVLFTFNRMGGEAYCTKGTVTNEGDITLDPYARRIVIAFDTTRLLTYPMVEYFDVKVSGKGHYYDNTVILNLNYNGLSTDSLHSLSTETVTVIAKRN